MRNKLVDQEIDKEVVDLIRNATKLVNINNELKTELEETKQKLEDTKKELFEQYDNLDYEWKKEEKAIKYLKDHEELIAIIGTHYYKLLEILGWCKE